ncbi:MAG: protein-L-isoaspartate(D-aspartate) O-methyltransferase [Thermoanaerobaculia bacterium]
MAAARVGVRSRRLAAALILGALLAPGAVRCDGPDDPFAAARHQMVERIRGRGVTDAAVLAALEAVPRHLFVPPADRAKAYEDRPLPIGDGQTISQPYMVALMTSLLELRPGERVLEVGTGSGYQAAILSRVAAEVYTIEIRKPFAERARRTLDALGYRNIQIRAGDGFQGWRDAAPFDGIIVTAAPPSVPDPLLRQLKTGGRLVIPVGDRNSLQSLLVLTKRRDGGFERSNVMPVFFVPMTGEAQRRER